MLASALACRPPAPPNATRANSLGTRPRCTVTTRSAPSIASSTMLDDRAGGLLDACAACLGDPRDGGVGRVDVQLELAAEQARRQMAEDDVRVGHGRARAAAAVAGRAGEGAGALGADPERARRLGDVGDRAAAGADAGDVDRRGAHGEVADVRLARDLRPPGHADGDVRRRPAHVEREDAVEARVGRDERRAADTAGRAGQDGLHRVLAGRLEAHQPAVRAHDLDRRPHVRGGEAVADVRQVLLERRGDVRVHQRRHGALVLAELGQDLGRDRERQVGRDGRGDLGDDPLVAPVGVGVEQADGQRLDPVGHELLDGGADGGLVDRLDDRPVGARPLGHLADVARVGQRLGLLVHHEPEQRPRRPGLREVEDVPESLRHDEAAERSAALQDGVRGDRGAVEDRVEVGKADARALGGEADPLDHADGLVQRRARRLRQPDALGVAVVEDDVRERPADVHAEAIGHAVSFAASTGSRYLSTRTSQLRAWPSKFSIRHWRAQISPIIALASSSHSWKVTVLRNFPTHRPPV